MTTITKVTVSQEVSFQIRQFESLRLGVHFEAQVDEEEFPDEVRSHLFGLATLSIADQMAGYIIGTVRAWELEEPPATAEKAVIWVRSMSAYQNLIKFSPEIAAEVLETTAEIVSGRIEAQEMKRIHEEAERVRLQAEALGLKLAEATAVQGELLALEVTADFDPDDDEVNGG